MRPTSLSSTPRWAVIDQTRGAAMALVWVSHFGLVYFRGAPASLPARLIAVTTRIATPTFVVLSGVLLGWLVSGEAARLAHVCSRFVDRALFLLLLAHPLIWAAHIPWAGGARQAARWEFVTDTLAVCMLLGPVVVAYVGGKARLVGSALAFAASWIVLDRFHGRPPGGAGGELLVGALSWHAVAYAFPVLPWLAVYLGATVLGEELRGLRARGLDLVARTAWRMALGLLGVAAAGAAAHRLLAGRDEVLWSMTGLYQKNPPGPVYLAVYGAAAMGLFAAFVELERRARLRAFGRVFALVGRNSLFAFVAQYVVYYTALALLHPAVSRAWGVWLAGSIVVLLAAVAAWDAVDGNRWFTIGLGRRRTARGAVAPDDGPSRATPPPLRAEEG